MRQHFDCHPLILRRRGRKESLGNLHVDGHEECLGSCLRSDRDLVADLIHGENVFLGRVADRCGPSVAFDARIPDLIIRRRANVCDSARLVNIDAHVGLWEGEDDPAVGGRFEPDGSVVPAQSLDAVEGHHGSSRIGGDGEMLEGSSIDAPGVYGDGGVGAWNTVEPLYRMRSRSCATKVCQCLSFRTRRRDAYRLSSASGAPVLSSRSCDWLWLSLHRLGTVSFANPRTWRFALPGSSFHAGVALVMSTSADFVFWPRTATAFHQIVI
jgi:hypothetical protein